MTTHNPGRLDHLRIAINAAGRDFGRTLAIRLADLGAELHLAARSADAAEAVATEIRERGHERVHAYRCDLTAPDTVAAFAGAVAERTDRVDVLINNGARYLAAADLVSASDEDIVATVASGTAGTVLTVKHFLPLLRRSDVPDIVTMVSTAGTPGHFLSDAHEAFYAAKAGQGGFTEVLSKRLRPEGIRVISLYPPDFANPDPLGEAWESTPRGPQDALTAQSLVDCVLFAIGQPRDCFIKSFHFEQAWQQH
ncbi:SDR family oxidoreductase [Yinghuangia soli]|uniref:SDR family oxidoreductase n=1 Tax=Yinghuangia soli TaxID=2908204 RepID=A0AA41Q9L1_9ACTN|nr:SDR family oxidoreductase [Yinghuangia soli]MCF2533286.1 SDR family oxidoreductase [Yinghuangia soli]